MEEKSKQDDRSQSPRWLEFQEEAKDDPELSRKLEVAQRVIERYSEALQRLADS